MTRNVAKWIQIERWLVNWDSIRVRALMQRDVKTANLSQNLDRKARIHAIPRFLNKFVPQGTEFVLQSWKSIDYVKFG